MDPHSFTVFLKMSTTVVGGRAAGPDYLPRSPLLVKGTPVRTETEGSYETSGKPVHRVAAVVVDAPSSGKKRPRGAE